ncbi:hypothetical protein GGI43DRAFT_418859 [Trichoderma evansii]
MLFADQKLKETWPSQLGVKGDDSEETKTARRRACIQRFVPNFVKCFKCLGKRVILKGANEAADTCNIDKVRIVHKDKSKLSLEEWDRIQRFIRLKKRTGWSIEETDMALNGLSAKTNDTERCTTCCKEHQRLGITEGVLVQVAGVRKLQEATKGVELVKLLALWANINTTGNPSLYQQLFRAHGIVDMDPVFTEDANDNFLGHDKKIKDYKPVILAAFNLRPTVLDAVLTHAKLDEANLTIWSMTVIYRYVLLSQMLKVQPDTLLEAVEIFDYDCTSDTTNPTDTLKFVNSVASINDSRLTMSQLSYLVKEDNHSEFAPNEMQVVETASTLLKGLNNIEGSYPDTTANFGNDPAEDDLAKLLSQLSSPVRVSNVLSLLKDTTAFMAEVLGGLKINHDGLNAHMDYPTTPDARGSVLTVKGLLTEDEKESAKGLSCDKGWLEAIDKIDQQAHAFFNVYLAPIFTNTQYNQVAQKLRSAEDSPDLKWAQLFKMFAPHLRSSLCEQFVVETMARTAEGVPLDVVKTLLAHLMSERADNSQSAMEALLDLKSLVVDDNKSCGGGDGEVWNGYLIPPTTGTYVFLCSRATKPSGITLGDQAPVPFVRQLAGDMWLTEPLQLTAGKSYRLIATKLVVTSMQWSAPESVPTTVPTSSLIPQVCCDIVERISQKLVKSSMLIQAFKLSIEELQFFQCKSVIQDFDFDINKPNLSGILRVMAYSDLRSSVSQTTTNLISLFKWARAVKASDVTLNGIVDKICEATQWNKADVSCLIGEKRWNMTDVASYRNEKVLSDIQSALTMVRKIMVDMHSLFRWSSPFAEFDQVSALVKDIRKSARSRYSMAEWGQTAKVVHDELRMAQRDALVAYLVVHESLAPYHVVDADTLFEFFLIDVQMGACMQTSRLQQAISSVQQFVQRCILGLEEDKYPTLKNDALDQERWKWMSKQSLWRANRMVFLWPELYTKPALRDDRSDLYLALEAEILQKDVDAQLIQDATKNYLFGLDQRANLLVQGIFEDDKDPSNHIVHFIAMTRSSPHVFFYRTYSATEENWKPWQLAPIDIPTYHVDALFLDNPDKPTLLPSEGSYVIPFVVGKRVLVFFGQLIPFSVPKTSPEDIMLPNPSDKAKKIQDKELQTKELLRLHTWEIRLGWVELKNEKWSNKQVTLSGISEPASSFTPPPMDMYQFVPYAREETLPDGTPVSWVLIVVYNRSGDAVGAFEFHGSQAFISSIPTKQLPQLAWDMRTSFHLAMSPRSSRRPQTWPTPTMYSLQDPATGVPFNPKGRPHVRYPVNTLDSIMTMKGKDIPFHHKFVHGLLNQLNQTDTLKPLFASLCRQCDADKSAFGHVLDKPGGDASFNELSQPYSLYNWELGFHAPMELAGNLLQSQHFDQALEMMHSVFDPYAKRLWKWLPFAGVNTTSLLEALLNKLQPNVPDKYSGPINMWRKHPFAPHLVARGRPLAYMKWTVLQYLDTLVAYGDWYFRHNSLETLPLALQMYVLASHMCGPKSQRIPKRTRTRLETYYSLLDKWDAFSNAMAQFENTLLFSQQTPHLVEDDFGNDLVLPNVAGSVGTHYFCVPDNPRVREIKALVDQRISNIRQCLDLNGKAVSYSLKGQNVDPAGVVAASSQGLNVSSFFNDLDRGLPNYRFQYLLPQALNLCAELRTAALMFLTVKEKRDSGAMNFLKAKQDAAMQQVVSRVRELQLEEANKTLEALIESRHGPLSRHQFYASLAGKDGTSLAEDDLDYVEIEVKIPAPVVAGDLVFSVQEKEDMDKSLLAKVTNDMVSVADIFAATLLSMPAVTAKVQPLGVGADISWGPKDIGQLTMGFARMLRVVADSFTFESTNAAKKASNIRQFQERVLAANVAGYELIHLNKSIVAQRSRIQLAKQEISNQELVARNAAGVVEFLTNKYTKDELYFYLEIETRKALHQMYTLAYDIAKKAEAAFLFERGPQAQDPSNPFIRFGYWDPARDGLLSGEALFLSLKQMEAAYLEKRGHDFEVTKTVSLRQIAPIALMRLRATGMCDFNVSEVLFDMDFPGHYSRRLRSVAVTIPCIVGPYTGVNATLTLRKHTYRISNDANSYQEQLEKHFHRSRVPINSIAISTAKGDTGVFELSFSSERYLPFEGAGAISWWRLELPQTLRTFDYGTISDVLLTIHYTSLDGGSKLNAAALNSVASFVQNFEKESNDIGLFAVLDLKAEFPSEWAHTAAEWTPQKPSKPITLQGIGDRLPLYARGCNPMARKVILITEMKKGAKYSLQTSLKTTTPFENIEGEGLSIEKLEIDASLEGPNIEWILNIDNSGPNNALANIWLIICFIQKQKQ